MLFKRPTRAIVFGSAAKPTRLAHFQQGSESIARARKNDKSGPTLVCVCYFDFDMCFAPQRRTLFEQLNFQKCSQAELISTFWLRNVLRATAAHIF